jgi:hypothetical protein
MTSNPYLVTTGPTAPAEVHGTSIYLSNKQARVAPVRTITKPTHEHSEAEKHTSDDDANESPVPPPEPQAAKQNYTPELNYALLSRELERCKSALKEVQDKNNELTEVNEGQDMVLDENALERHQRENYIKELKEEYASSLIEVYKNCQSQLQTIKTATCG